MSARKRDDSVLFLILGLVCIAAVIIMAGICIAMELQARGL